MNHLPDIPRSPAPPPAPRPPRPPRRPLPSPLAVITASLGLFLIVLTLMAIQVRNGRDPAIGPGPVIPKGKNAAKPGSKTPAAASVVSQTSPVPP